MSPELAKRQLSSLQRHYGTRSRPVLGSEHWRYGAFQFILRRAANEATLVRMLLVARQDPDVALGEAMLTDISKHPLAGLEVERSKTMEPTR
jgi:hypothetical protein